MKKVLPIFSFLFIATFASSQCNLDFSDAVKFPFTLVDGSDIVNGTSEINSTKTQSFDIWDEGSAPLNCSSAGVANDITFDFEIISVFEIYNTEGIVKDVLTNATHEIIQDGTGLKGKIPMGDSGLNETTHGDVRGYQITVTFANHLSIAASDIVVNQTSVNTKGKIFESSSLVFLDGTGTPYGTTTYNGYYGTGSPGASINPTCSAPAPSGSPWSTSGTGVYVIAETSTVTTTLCDAVGGTTSGSENNKDVAAVADAGLSPSDQVGGFIFTVYAEDVAPSTGTGNNTTTSTAFTSTLNGVDISSAALPVELTSFDAKKSNDEVILRWNTASEINNDHFEIERSTDGTDFTKIGNVEGLGQSNFSNDYRFIDAQPKNGLNYYRLKQVDFDGKYEYSEIVNVDFKTEDKIKLYPTLSTSEINITLPGNSNDVTYKIINFTGQILQEGAFENNTITKSINVHNFPKGSYLIQVGNNSFSEILRFNKI